MTPHLDVEEALNGRGFDIRLFTPYQQVILFGSRAAGCAHSSSDWDILLIGGSCRLPQVPNFDLVTIAHLDGESALRWHSTELAVHVRRYGVWLVGAPPEEWLMDFQRVVNRKHHLVGVRIRTLRSVWGSLSRVRRDRELILLRRELQRLGLLRQGEPVPPRQVLDDAWDRGTVDLAALCEGLEVPASLLRSWFSYE